MQQLSELGVRPEMSVPGTARVIVSNEKLQDLRDPTAGNEVLCHLWNALGGAECSNPPPGGQGGTRAQGDTGRILSPRETSHSSLRYNFFLLMEGCHGKGSKKVSTEITHLLALPFDNLLECLRSPGQA